MYDAGSQSAENALGGVRIDSIPKEGGNNFSGVWRTVGSKGTLQGDNITDELKPYISVNTQLAIGRDVVDPDALELQQEAQPLRRVDDASPMVDA